MILPKLALFSRAFGCFGCLLRFGPDKGKVIVFKAYQSGTVVRLNELASRASGELLAERSLKVTKLFNNDRRTGRPPRFAVRC